MKRRQLAGITALLLLSCAHRTASAADNEKDVVLDSIPGDASLVLVINDVSQARANFNQTSLGRMIEEPSVKAFREHGLKKFREKLAEVREAYGFQPSDLWTLFPGKMAATVVLSPAKEPASGQPRAAASFIMVSELRDGADRAREFLGNLAAFFQDQSRVEIAKKGDRYELVQKESGPGCVYGVAGSRFVAVLGDNAPELFSRLAEAPAPGVRPAYPSGQGGFVVVNVAKLISLAADSRRGMAAILEGLGLKNLRHGWYGLKFNNRQGGYDASARLQFDGPRTGLAALAGNVPLDVSILSHVPADADRIAALSFDLGGLLPVIREVARALGDGMDLDRGLAEIKASSGIDLEALLKEGLGSRLACFSKSPAGGLQVFGMQAPDAGLVVEAGDREMLVEAVERFAEFVRVRGDGAQGRQFFKLEQTSVDGATIRYLTLLDNPLAALFSPAFVVTDRSLILALHPKTLIAAVNAKASPIAEEPDFSRVWQEADAAGARYLSWRKGSFNPGVLATVPMLASIAVPNFVRARGAAQQNACVNNMRQIEIAKAQWQSDRNLEAREDITLEKLVADGYLKAQPVCPADGEYRPGNLNHEPSCAAHGDMSSPRRAATTARVASKTGKVAVPSDPSELLQMIDWVFWPAAIPPGPRQVSYFYGVKKDDHTDYHGHAHLEIPAISVGSAGLLAAIAIPNFVKARTTAQKNACINNLRQLDGAKEQWALENRKRWGDQVPQSEVEKYVKQWPQCPAGGTYEIGTVGENPRCSIPGHDI